MSDKATKKHDRSAYPWRAFARWLAIDCVELECGHVELTRRVAKRYRCESCYLSGRDRAEKMVYEAFVEGREGEENAD